MGCAVQVGVSVTSYLARQAGLVSREQALRAGLSRDDVDRRVATRRWRPVHPRVYLAEGHPLGDEARVRAALLWAGPDAVLGGLAAAWWHGMADHLPSTVTLAVPRRRPPAARPGVVVVRRAVAAPDRVERRGVAVTDRPLTLLDAAVELGAAGEALLHTILRDPAAGVTFDAVLEAHRRNGGTAAAGRLLAAVAQRSATEALVGLLRESRLPGWSRGHVVAGHGVDVAFPAVRLAIEVHGWSPHDDPGRAALRQGVLHRLGWTVLRVDWHDVTARRARLLDEIAVHTGHRVPA